MHLLAAFDKFRGSLTAPDACGAAAGAAAKLGWTADELPMADGGEGTLEALGGPNRASVVTGPLGERVTAEWQLANGLAVIEMARASGLVLAGGAARNSPVEATTRGTGELIREAIERGAQRIIVGVGGSATTDGGWGALEAIGSVPNWVTIDVACDVTTRFLDAARIYGPQKGANADQVSFLAERLTTIAGIYEKRGADIRDLPGSGAAGGLGGGLAAAGAHLRSGFEVVAQELDLDSHIRRADLVVTGEGKLDETSWRGKVVGGVVAAAQAQGVACFVVVGAADPGADMPRHVEVATLVDLLGPTAAFQQAAAGVTTLVADRLRRWA